MRWLVPILAAACCTACVHAVALSPEIGPGHSTSLRSSEKAGVVCSERLLGHVERAHVDTLTGFATRYELELGEPLCAALVRAVEGSYRAAQRTVRPYKGQYGRIIKLDLEKSALHIGPRDDGSMRVAYTLSVVVEQQGRDLQPLGRSVATGDSLVDCGEAPDRAVQQAVEAALQQVVDEASSLLVARLDGPRVPASPSQQAPATPLR